MTQPLVLFSHGQESGPWGTKITALAALVRAQGFAADSIDYQGIADPSARVEKLVGSCAAIAESPEFASGVSILLVGSSMGGHVSAAAASQVPQVSALLLMAPAFYMPGYEALTPTPTSLPTVIVHGWHDDIVSVENSIRYARTGSAKLVIVNDDHRLTASVDTVGEELIKLLTLARGTP